MANRTDNPFFISGYASPEYFCDREKETEELLASLENGRNITLMSPRRLGKTGLIKHLFHFLGQQGATVIYVDLFPTTCLHDFTLSFANAVLGQLDSNPVKLLKKVTSFFKELRPNLSLDPVSGQPKIGLDIASGAEEHTLEQVFHYLRENAKNCYIALDEFQQIAQYPEKNVEALLRSYIQDLHGVHFIFSGSQSHLLGEMFLSPKRPFYQSTSEKVIGPIDENSYYLFAQNFFSQKQGRELSEDVFHQIYTAYEGYTWYVQMILNRLWEKSSREIDAGLVQECAGDVLNENEYYYQQLLQLCTKGQAKLLKAIAKEKKVKGITSGAFVAKYGLTAASSVKSAVANMLDEEIVYCSDGTYRVYDWFFGQWLASRF